MAIGQDIKDVLEELGTSLSIYKYPGPTIIEEVCDHEFFSTHSSEFLRQFFSGITVPFDTQLLSGDIVAAMGYHFLCTTLAPNNFENAPVDYTAVFYRCNVLGKLDRYPQNATFDANYVKTRTWTTIHDNVYALEYENQFDQKHVIEEDIVAITQKGHLLYLPSHVEVEEGDRWYPDRTVATKFFRVSTIDTFRLDNVSIATLNDDTRE